MVPPDRPASVRRNFAWNLVGGGAFVASQWAILMALAKIGDGTTAEANLGRFALALVVLQPMLQVAHAELRQVQATDGARSRSPALYLTARAMAVAVVLAVVAGIAALWGRDPATSWTLLAVAAAKAFESASDVCYGRFEQRERMHLVARSQLLRGLVGLVAFGGALHATESAAVAAAAMALAWAAVFAAHDLPFALARAPDDPPRWQGPSPRAALALLAHTLPLGLGTGLASLAINTPSYALEALVGTAAVGRYAAVAYFVSALRMPAMAAGIALAPGLARHLSAGDFRRARRRSAWLVLGAAAPGIVALPAVALAGPYLLALVYRPSFAALSPVLLLLVAAAALGFAGYGFRLALTAAGRYGSQLPPVLAMLAVTAAVAFGLVPRLGVAGAALGLLCGRIAQLVLLATTYLRHLAAAERAGAGATEAPRAPDADAKLP